MGFRKKTRVTGRLGLFALVVVIVIGTSLPVVHAVSQDRVLQLEPVSGSVDRAKKGDRLRRFPSKDAAQKPGGKPMDIRPRETRLAAIETNLCEPDAVLFGGHSQQSPIAAVI